ncbi:restriction endonuclease subunit S [Salmonella enterica subsp. enterica serovar Ramatgan]|nr:restriction endonuclease subunit S [Salmonella enterica subsp. enterica serovar Ramatgan]
MSWPMVKLGDVCQITMGQAPSGSFYNEKGQGYALIAGAGDFGQINPIPKKYTTKASKLSKSGDIILCIRATIGDLNWSDKEYCLGRGVAGLRGKERLDQGFLWHCLNYNKNTLSSKGTGSTFKQISRNHIEELIIPFPPIEEQKRIAAILDKADSIRQKREQAIKLADDFLHAAFLELFGDPVENPKGWQRMKFSEVGTLDRGKSKHRPRNAPELLGGIHPLIQTGDVANSGGYITDYFSTYSDIGLAQSKMWKKGTLCITIAANIAKTGILTFDACFPDSVVGFQPNQHVEIEFIQHWLGFLQKQLEETAPEVAQKNINLAILRDLDVIVPDKALQMKFKGVVKKVRELKEKYHNFPYIQPVLSSFHLS